VRDAKELEAPLAAADDLLLDLPDAAFQESLAWTSRPCFSSNEFSPIGRT
jgi:hypothetical protein